MAGPGKNEQPMVRLVTAWPPPRTRVAKWTVFCPFMEGLDPELAFWLGGLAWHDANASLLAALRIPASASHVYAGVFCVDPFRRDDDLFGALRQAGVTGVVNLPSVAFIDGELGAILGSFDLGASRELDFLRRAHLAGLRIAGCAGSVEVADVLAQSGADFIIAHGGPPQPGSPDPSRGAARRLRRRFEAGGPEIIGVTELLATLRTPPRRETTSPQVDPRQGRNRR